MNTGEGKQEALVQVQSTALTKVGARSLAARGRDHLRDKEAAEEWQRKGLDLLETAPADPRVPCRPINPYAKRRWLFRNGSDAFRRIDQEGQVQQEQWRKRQEALQEALLCFDTGSKLDPSNSELLFCLADSYYREDQLEGNELRAVSLFQRAADLGHAGAQLAIADAHARLGFSCLPRDERQAAKWYQISAERGNEEALDYFVYYFQPGIGSDHEQAGAVRLIREAAGKGDSRAQYLLGVLYDNGQGVQQDDAQAVIWLRKAAEQGNTDAQVSLGLAYKTGHGIKQDDAQAAIWFRKAKNEGGEEEVEDDQIRHA